MTTGTSVQSEVNNMQREYTENELKDKLMMCPRQQHFKYTESATVRLMPKFFIVSNNKIMRMQNQNGSSTETNIEKKISINNTVYELTSIMIRLGNSPDSGHYISYSKRGERWYEFNDSKVKNIDQLEKKYKNVYGLIYSQLQ